MNDKFIPFATRTFHEISVDVSNFDSEFVTGEIIKNILSETTNISDTDFIKVILTGDVDVNADIDLIRIRQYMEGKAYFFKIYNNTKNKIDFQSYVNDKTLKGEFVRLMEQQDEEDNVKLKVIESEQPEGRNNRHPFPLKLHSPCSNRGANLKGTGKKKKIKGTGELPRHFPGT